MPKTQKVRVTLKKCLRVVKCHLRMGKLYTHRSNKLLGSDAILSIDFGW